MYKNYIKRIIDVILSIIALIVLFPLCLIIGITIKIIDKGPIFYIQDRTGRYGKNFKIYKFKTMKNREITKLGSILRNTSLDELPQFFNVLKGDMSIVGPRPWIPEYYNNFNEEQKKRTFVRPGLVGLAQVNGRKKITIFEKINYDIEYVNDLNFWLDLRIIIKSLKVIITKESSSNVENYINNEIELLKNQ